METILRGSHAKGVIPSQPFNPALGGTQGPEPVEGAK
jgi:hypothetical protein